MAQIGACCCSPLMLPNAPHRTHQARSVHAWIDSAPKFGRDSRPQIATRRWPRSSSCGVNTNWPGAVSCLGSENATSGIAESSRPSSKASAFARLTIADVERMLDALAAQGNRQRQGSSVRTGHARGVHTTTIQILEPAPTRDDHTKRRRAGLHGPANDSTRPRRSLTPEEARLLFDWLGAKGVGEHLSPMFRFGLLTGLRPGELSGFSGTTSISSGAVSSSVTRCEWKGTEPSSCQCSRRRVRIELSGYRRSRCMNSDDTRCASLSSGSRRPRGVTNTSVFASLAGTVLYARNVRHELQKACVAAGIPEITPHELRHTAASLMVDDGQALEQVADYLGHGSTRMLDSRTATECARRLMPRSKPWTVCSGHDNPEH